MKKINTTEANAIVGGHIPKTCEVDFNTVGDECFKVTTCADKNGKTVSEKSEAADLDLCGMSVPG